MSRANDCAFPATREEKYVAPDEICVGTYQVVHGGLTIREHFAAMAMQGLLAYHGAADYSDNPTAMAREARKHADALIAELAKPIEQPLDERGNPVKS